MATEVMFFAVYKLKTIQDMLMKIYRNKKHHQTSCRPQIIFPEKGSHTLHPFRIWACNDNKQLVWVNFLDVSGSWGRPICFFFVKNSSSFRLKPLFALVEKSKFKNGRVHSRKSGMKGFTWV